jgi:hypothetical protein
MCSQSVHHAYLPEPRRNACSDAGADPKHLMMCAREQHHLHASCKFPLLVLSVRGKGKFSPLAASAACSCACRALARWPACASWAPRALRCSSASASFPSRSALSTSHPFRASLSCAPTWTARSSASCEAPSSCQAGVCICSTPFGRLTTASHCSADVLSRSCWGTSADGVPEAVSSIRAAQHERTTCVDMLQICLAFSLAFARLKSDCKSLMTLLLDARSAASWSHFCFRASSSAVALERFLRAWPSSVSALLL